MKNRIDCGVVPIYCGSKQDFIFLKKNNKNKWDFFYGNVQDDEDIQETAMKHFIKQSGINPQYFEVSDRLNYKIGKKGGYQRKLFLVFLKKGHHKYIEDKENIKRVRIENVDKYVRHDKYKDLLSKVKSIF